MMETTGAATGRERTTRKLTILIVEDHADTLEVFTRLLQAAGHNVLPASTAAMALELAAHGAPDVVMADAELPDGTGWKLFELLKETYPQVVGVAVTAHGFPHHVQQSKAAGFCEHLTKPVSAADLKNAIDRCIAMRAAAAA
jgi:CheY-like chemotaxis protein